MGKSQKKTGKGRLDKYYKLAKYYPRFLYISYSFIYI
jgi:predicted transcriptional regulator